MMMIGTLRDLTVNRDGSQNVTVTVNSNFAEAFDELKDKPVKVEIKRYSKQRTLTANAYAWALIDQIAAKQQMLERKAGWTPVKVYQRAIKDVGGIMEIYGVKEEAFESFKVLWCGDHLGRQVEIIPGSGKPGWLNVKAWKGSSDFDTHQMTRFIDNLIQDAESLGIPTITPKEEERLLEMWGRKTEKKGESNGNHSQSE